MFKQPVQEWESNIEGRQYHFRCEFQKGLGYVVTVNGEPITVKGGFTSMMFGFDEPFTLDGKQMHLVATKGGMDVAYDGQFLISGKPYVARPIWVWMFVLMCVSLIFLFGMMGGFLGFVGAAVCIAASKTTLPTIVRVLLCTLVVSVTWFAAIVIAQMLATL